MNKILTILALLMLFIVPLALGRAVEKQIATPMEFIGHSTTSHSSINKIKTPDPELTTTIKVANAEIHNIQQMSFAHSKLHIKAEIQNTGDADAKNIYYELVYQPTDYLIGPTVVIHAAPGNPGSPIDKIKPGHKKNLNFIVDIYDFFLIGPFESGEFEEMEFYIKAVGDNTNNVKSRVMSFIPIEEANPFYLVVMNHAKTTQIN